MTSRADTELTDTIARILRLGTVMSAVIIAVGILMVLAVPPEGTPATLQAAIAMKFGGVSLSTSAWLGGFLKGDGLSVLQLGTLVLLATPLVRVGASVLLFRRERDGLYVRITLFVLAMLLIAIFVLGPLES